MRPQNPYQALINQFLSIPQTIQQGIVRRDEQQRSDRIRDEERQQQLADEERRRNQQLTDVAQSERLRQIGLIQQNLPFLEPGSEGASRGLSAIEQLSKPLELEGQDALNSVIRGDLLFPRTVEAIRERRPGPDGGPVETQEEQVVQEPGNVNVLLGELGRARREAELEGVTAQTLFDRLAGYLSDVKIDNEARVRYLNDAVMPSDILTDDQKRALAVTAGMRDEDARRIVEQNLQVNELDLKLKSVQVSSARTQEARNALALSQEQRLADLEYEQAQQQVQEGRDRSLAHDVRMFQEVGIVPADASRAERLLRSLPFEAAEDMERVGRQRYARLQQRERIEHRVAQQAEQLQTLQIDQVELANQTADYNLNRLQGFGAIQDATQLATTAFAAAANGDAATVEMLEGLANADPERYGEALRVLNFDSLRATAEEAIGDADDAREFQREQNAALLSQYRRGALVDTSTFANAVAGRMVHLEEGEVEGEVDRFISTLSGDELAAFGGKDAFRATLMAEARFQRRELERKQGGLTVELLAKAVPSPNDDRSRSPEQTEWKDNFILAAVDAGLDPDHAGSIAEGLLSGSNLDYWEAALRQRQLQLQINKLERDAENEGFDLDTIKVLLSAESDRSLNANRMLENPKCAVSNPAGGQAYNTADPDCAAAWATLQSSEARVDALSRMLQPTPIAAALAAGEEEAYERAITEGLSSRWQQVADSGSREEIIAMREQSLEREDVADNEVRRQLLDQILPAPGPVESNPSLVGAGRSVVGGIHSAGVGLADALYNDLPRFIADQVSPEQVDLVLTSDRYGDAIASFRHDGTHNEDAIKAISAETGVAVNRVRQAIEQRTRALRNQ